MSGLKVPVSTECFLIDEAVSLDTAEVRYGLAAVQVGKTVPPGMLEPGLMCRQPGAHERVDPQTSLKS